MDKGFILRILTVASIILGFLIFLTAFIYLGKYLKAFDEDTMKGFEQLCDGKDFETKERPRPTQAPDPPPDPMPDPTTVQKMTTQSGRRYRRNEGRQGDKAIEEYNKKKKRDCTYARIRYSAAAIGILAGLGQMAGAGAMLFFILKRRSFDPRRLIWIILHAVFFVLCLIEVSLLVEGNKAVFDLPDEYATLKVFAPLNAYLSFIAINMMFLVGAIICVVYFFYMNPNRVQPAPQYSYQPQPQPQPQYQPPPSSSPYKSRSGSRSKGSRSARNR